MWSAEGTYGLEPCSVRSIVAARPWSGLAARFALTNSGRLPAADSPLWGTIRVVTQWVIRHRRKQGGVLTRAVRGTGIPSAVRVRFLIEANSGLQPKQYPLCRPRLRKDFPRSPRRCFTSRAHRFDVRDGTQQKIRATVKVVLIFVWSVLDSNQ